MGDVWIMKINKQELLDNMNKIMEKIGQDEVFARALAEKQTSAEVAEFLLDNGISISKDTIDYLYNIYYNKGIEARIIPQTHKILAIP